MVAHSRPGQLRPQRERHFFIVSGLPENYSWQRLKDIVRQCTANQPGWTNMDDSWNGPHGAKGYFSVKSDPDAAKVYNSLVSNIFAYLQRPLLVHHFDASGYEPQLLRCNCPSYFPGTSTHSDRSCITTKSVSSALRSPDWQPMTPVPFVAIPMQYPNMPLPMHVQQMPLYVPPVTYYQQMPAMTIPAQVSPVMTNEHGLPVNPTNGVVRTESRGVHISSLPHAATETDIREMVRRYGQPEAVEMRGTSATVRFGSIEEVRRTIQGVDKTMWGGRQITVKEDRDSTSIPSSSISGPGAIVHGGPQGRVLPANW